MDKKLHMKNNYKFKTENHNFWKERLKSNPENLVCSNDIKLDLLEGNQILNENLKNKTILEIGCGNGILYRKICKKYKIKKYVGLDFVKELIDVCNKKKRRKNDIFLQQDMTDLSKDTFRQKFDFIITKRSVQNVISHSLQIKVIDNLGYFLKKNGKLILIESSQDAQKNINDQRKLLKLKRIYPPFHNLFLSDVKIKKYNFKNIKLKKIIPFASDYYYITRIIYAYFTKNFLNQKPSFQHPMQNVSLDISLKSKLSTQDYSQVQKYIFTKSQ